MDSDGISTADCACVRSHGVFTAVCACYMLSHTVIFCFSVGARQVFWGAFGKMCRMAEPGTERRIALACGRALLVVVYTTATALRLLRSDTGLSHVFSLEFFVVVHLRHEDGCLFAECTTRALIHGDARSWGKGGNQCGAGYAFLTAASAYSDHHMENHVAKQGE